MMTRQRWSLPHCQACTNQNDNDPPCARLEKQRQQSLLAARSQTVGGSPAWCPCIISWKEVLTYAQGLNRYKAICTVNPAADALLQILQHRLHRDPSAKRDPLGVHFYEAPQAAGNYSSMFEVQHEDGDKFGDDRKLVAQVLGTWHFLRRLEDDDVAYNAQFRAENGLGIFYNDPQEKLRVCMYLASPLIAQRIGGEIAAMFAPQAIGLTIATMACMLGPQSALLGFLRLLLNGVGIAMQVAEISYSLYGFVSGLYAASCLRDLQDAANYFANFLAGLASAGLLIVFGAALKKGESAWKSAAEEAKTKARPEPQPPRPRTPPKIARAAAAARTGSPDAAAARSASEAGMQPWHVRSWIVWARRTKSLVVLRTCNLKSLPRHFDELVTGKSVEVKWKTAHSGPNQGLVVVPSASGVSRLKVVEEIQKLRKLGYTFKPRRPEGTMPESGDLLIGPDGRAFCGDVDKMGIYVVDGGRARPHPDWAVYNDDPALRQRLQREVYGGGAAMDQHGCQDFWQVGVDGNGRPVMGRRPEATEKFLIVEPDGHSSVVNLSQLRSLYHLYGIHWPYG